MRSFIETLPRAQNPPKAGVSSRPPKIKFVKMDANAILPTRKDERDAGIDFYALEDVDVYPGDTVKVHTGVCMEMPAEWDREDTVAMAHVEDRSSVGSKGIHHTAGVIDYGYNKGEIVICVANLNIYDVLQSLRIVSDAPTHHGAGRAGVSLGPKITFDWEPYKIKAGDKICQVVLQPVYKGDPIEVELEDLENRARGAKGFGSSGK